MKKIEFTQEQLQDIFNKYQIDHLSMAKIGKLYGVSKTVITRILKENNIEIRKDNHKYFADYRKFEVIDTPEKAYWLGFIAADGCVYEREENATIRIAIHRKDKEHLEKLKTFMNSNVLINDYINDTGYSAHNPTPMSVICFNSKAMAHDLIKHGIVPNKSLILQKPIINKELYLPYIMGYFDGDGTIYKTNNNTEFVIGFIGSYGTISWINKELDLNAKLEQRVEGSQTYSIRCGGTNKPYQIMKPVYDSVNICLDRKYILFQELENVVFGRNTK